MTKRCILLAFLAAGFVVTNSYADGGGEGRAKLPSPHSASLSDGAGRVARLGEAGPEQTTEAVAHFARSRSLIIAALNEFDKGRKIANPSNLLDTKEWRNDLIDRAEDLDRVLDPQPRATRGGIKFEADRRLLPEASK